MSSLSTRILYCRCAFAQVVPESTKEEVLERLCDSEQEFECVPDLCEMAARKDERLATLIEGEEPIRIAACYPRAVKWLFHQAGLSVPEEKSIEVLNMRDSSSEDVASGLLKE